MFYRNCRLLVIKTYIKNMQLPLKKIPAITQDPRNLIIYGSPKIGKTSLLSTLEDCVILDMEGGSDYVDAVKVKIETLQDYVEFCKAVKEAGNPYKFAAIDTVTALEEFAKPMALADYRKTPAGSKFEGDILTAPMGAGYAYVRIAIEKLIDALSKVVPNIILVGHVKDKALVTVTNQEIGNIKDFDLTGKTSRILAAKSDAIGFINRDEDSNLYISFETSGEAAVGARPTHLANNRIVVAERQEDGTFVSHWDRIYPSLKQ